MSSFVQFSSLGFLFNVYSSGDPTGRAICNVTVHSEFLRLAYVYCETFRNSMSSQRIDIIKHLYA